MAGGLLRRNVLRTMGGVVLHKTTIEKLSLEVLSSIGNNNGANWHILPIAMNWPHPSVNIPLHRFNCWPL